MADLDLDELERLRAAIYGRDDDGDETKDLDRALEFVDALEPHWPALVASARRLAAGPAPSVPSDPDLDELERLHAAATPGPWGHTAGCLKHYVWSDNGDLGFSMQSLHPDDGRDVPAEANARLIVAARNALPALIASARRLAEVGARRCDNCAESSDIRPGHIHCAGLGMAVCADHCCKCWRAR